MQSSRRERLYLLDIVEAGEAISRFVAGIDRERFVGDDLMRSAVLHKLQVIGEAAGRVSETTRALAPAVPWRQVVGFRNFTVHAYFSVDWDVVWATAIDDAPAITSAVRILLASLPTPDVSA